jgi:hypothetical protein
MVSPMMTKDVGDPFSSCSRWPPAGPHYQEYVITWVAVGAVDPDSRRYHVRMIWIIGSAQ